MQQLQVVLCAPGPRPLEPIPDPSAAEFPSPRDPSCGGHCSTDSDSPGDSPCSWRTQATATGSPRLLSHLRNHGVLWQGPGIKSPSLGSSATHANVGLGPTSWPISLQSPPQAAAESTSELLSPANSDRLRPHFGIRCSEWAAHMPSSNAGRSAALLRRTLRKASSLNTEHMKKVGDEDHALRFRFDTAGGVPTPPAASPDGADVRPRSPAVAEAASGCAAESLSADRCAPRMSAWRSRRRQQLQRVGSAKAATATAAAAAPGAEAVRSRMHAAPANGSAEARAPEARGVLAVGARAPPTVLVSPRGAQAVSAEAGRGPEAGRGLPRNSHRRTASATSFRLPCPGLHSHPGSRHDTHPSMHLNIPLCAFNEQKGADCSRDSAYGATAALPTGPTESHEVPCSPASPPTLSDSSAQPAMATATLSRQTALLEAAWRESSAGEEATRGKEASRGKGGRAGRLMLRTFSLPKLWGASRGAEGGAGSRSSL